MADRNPDEPEGNIKKEAGPAFGYRMLSRSALVLLISTGCAASAPSPEIVVLRPGQDLQAVVARHSEGTEFRFEPGLYRQQTIEPKDRQSFIGQDGVVLSGAMPLATWTREPGRWRSERIPSPQRFHGECRDGSDICKFREDLFLNGRVLKRVTAPDHLGPGRWYYEDRRAYLADDPSGQNVELGVTPLAFGGEARDVLLKDLIVEKYASDAQYGAIHIAQATGWRIVNVTARWNHGTGLSFGPKTVVIGGTFSHNGQLGMAGIGAGAKVRGAEIAFNNYAGYDPRWEAGGTKFWETKRLIVRDSCVHHNRGPGLWTDNDNIDVTYDRNKVFMNDYAGIKHEISYRGSIRANVVAYNGRSYDNWLWGSQILIQNSRDVEVEGNRVEVARDFGNGIGVIHQDRGGGAYGPWHATDNVIRNNTIVHLGRSGLNGVVTDTGDETFWQEALNRFDHNRYIIADEEAEHWTSNDRDVSWEELDELDLEPDGELAIAQRRPLTLSCEP